MKIHRLILLAAVLWTTAAIQQACSHVPGEAAPAEADARWVRDSGLDGLYDMSPKAATPAPRGYEAVYVSHYGRHGSRYAYTPKTYRVPLEMLREGAAADNLTERGQKLLDELEAFWEKGQYLVGDLTPLGWQQHRYIAETMVKSFPKAFGRGSSVDACSSASVRAIMSMASCCAAISRTAPQSSVYAHQGIMDIQATRPNHGGANPFRYEGVEEPFPYGESPEQFFLRLMPDYSKVLARIFKDPGACINGRRLHGYGGIFFYYYMLVVGMQSIPEEQRIDVSGLLTPDELDILYETDNYERFREFFNYRISCSSIVDDIIAKADARLGAGSRGADLRFGHDHVLLTLLMIMDIEDFGHVASEPDSVWDWFRSCRSPMAANIQFVFYTPRRHRSGDVLVKILLNGEETRMGDIAPVDGPYYRWEDARAWMNARTALFVTKR